MAATIFDGVSAANPQRSTFDLSHDRKYTIKAGELTPVFVQEVVPGDKFRINASHFIRMIPLVGPVMHRIDMDIHFFYVPNRIVWKNWEKFISGSRLAGAEAGQVPVHPFIDMTVDLTAFHEGSLYDHLGYPVFRNSYDILEGGAFKLNSLPLRAYLLIYKEFYRDQNLVKFDDYWEDFYESDGDEFDHLADFPTILKRSWEKDYFTSALPFVQKGDPLTIPLAGKAPIAYDYAAVEDGKIGIFRHNTGDDRPENATTPEWWNAPDGQTKLVGQDAASNYYNQIYDPNGTLYANLAGASATTVNDLRTAFQAQIWLERNARAGTRYLELLEAHFGVRPADYRLQRPELFGAMRVPVQISEVLQTSETSTSPQGNMAGHAVGYGKDNFSVFCPEHGWIIGIASIKPRTSYAYAIHKSRFRLDYLDYYWPEFARLGEQEIKCKELGFPNGVEIADRPKLERTFGYQSRYAEYRSAFSTVHGGMRHDPVLSTWHMARNNVDYHSVLSKQFVEADPTKRIFADTQADYEYIVHSQFNVLAKRPMPYFADPGFIDHP